MDTGSTPRALRSYAWIGWLLVLGLAGWQVYLGAIVQELGIPGVFTIKFGEKTSHPFTLPSSDRTKKILDLGTWARCDYGEPKFKNSNYNCNLFHDSAGRWVLTNEIFDTTNAGSCFAICQK